MVRAMSFVVRHKQTGDFLRGQGEWTERLEEAAHFNSGIRLVHYLEWLGLARLPDLLEILPVPAEKRAVFS